jgi:hypothetical protein
MLSAPMGTPHLAGQLMGFGIGSFMARTLGITHEEEEEEDEE